MHEESKTKASACQHETTNKKRRRKYNKRREETAAQEGEEEEDKRSPFVRVNVFTEDFVTNEMFSRKMQCDVLSTK